MSVLYIEPFSGMAGDMFLAALLDLDDPRFSLNDLRAVSDALVPGECRITVERAWRQNLSGNLLTLVTSETEHAPHRGLKEITAIVEAAPFSSAVKARALSVFQRIAVAEGKVHGCSPEEIHFHEVGAVDTIVDVCGAAVALEKLGVTRVVAHAPVTGTGTVKCAHGIMPVPAPAVAELLRGRAIAIEGGGGERLTPTGAALLVDLCAEFGAPGAFAPERVGYGAGHRDPKEGPPNILRVQLGRVDAQTESARVVQIDVNLDDLTGEAAAHAAESLRAMGALDVWLQPVTMKKGRPGVVLSLLCRPEQRVQFESAIFASTPTLGVRWTAYERTECARRSLTVEVLGASVRVKLRIRPGVKEPGYDDLSPEHDDLAALAARTGRSLRELEALAITAALAQLE